MAHVHDAGEPKDRPHTLPRRRSGPVAAVLFDRDGTLVHDVPYNGDPRRVRPVDGAHGALERLRGAGVHVGLISNQSGIARGLLEPEDVERVHERLLELLGPLEPVLYCPHGPEDDCGCRKPAPGMVLDAARRLGVAPQDVAVVGDIGTDVEAARRAGAHPILVPTPATLPAEVAAAPVVAADLTAAVDLVLADEG